MSAVEEKKQLRKQINLDLEKMSASDIQSQSDKACDILLQSELFSSSNIVFSYMAMKKEISPFAITNMALQKNKIVALPKTIHNTNDMYFYIIKKTDPLENQLTSGAWGIMEPSENDCALFQLKNYFEKNILIIVPGVAFTRHGERLGHGMGFYDKSLSFLKKNCGNTNCKIITVGMCLTDQVVDSIPTEITDEKMDYLLTSNGFFC